MRIPQNPILPVQPFEASEYDKQFLSAITIALRDIAQQINQLSEGSIVASYNAATAIPTVGTWQQGDFIRNKTPVEAGAVASKYTISGWVCVAAGTPGTWKECRCLTGN